MFGDDRRGIGNLLQQLYRKNVLGTAAKPGFGRTLTNAVNLPMNAAIGGIAGAPVRAGSGMLQSMLLGRKAWSGPMKGKRLHAIAGGPGKGLSEIGLKEYLDIKKGNVAGKAYKGKIGLTPYLFKRKFGPKGLVGAAKSHPILAALAGLAGYKMLTGGGGATQPQNHRLSLDPAVLRSMQQRQAQNPFERSDWG